MFHSEKLLNQNSEKAKKYYGEHRLIWVEAFLLALLWAQHFPQCVALPSCVVAPVGSGLPSLGQETQGLAVPCGWCGPLWPRAAIGASRCSALICSHRNEHTRHSGSLVMLVVIWNSWALAPTAVVKLLWKDVYCNNWQCNYSDVTQMMEKHKI